jgi:hypothetical protein
MQLLSMRQSFRPFESDVQYYTLYTVLKMDLILRWPKVYAPAAMQIYSNVNNLKCILSRLIRHDWSMLKNTGGALTISLWICSSRLYHCSIVTCETLSIF